MRKQSPKRSKQSRRSHLPKFPSAPDVLRIKQPKVKALNFGPAIAEVVSLFASIRRSSIDLVQISISSAEDSQCAWEKGSTMMSVGIIHLPCDELY